MSGGYKNLAWAPILTCRAASALPSAARSAAADTSASSLMPLAVMATESLAEFLSASEANSAATWTGVEEGLKVAIGCPFGVQRAVRVLVQA